MSGHYFAPTVEYQYEQVVQTFFHIGRYCTCVGATTHNGQCYLQTDTRRCAFHHTRGIELIAHTTRNK